MDQTRRPTSFRSRNRQKVGLRTTQSSAIFSVQQSASDTAALLCHMDVSSAYYKYIILRKKRETPEDLFDATNILSMYLSWSELDTCIQKQKIVNDSIVYKLVLRFDIETAAMIRSPNHSAMETAATHHCLGQHLVTWFILPPPPNHVNKQCRLAVSSLGMYFFDFTLSLFEIRASI